MRKTSLAAAAVLFGVGFTSADAADLGPGSPMDGPVSATNPPIWAGLYAGGSAGFGTGDTSGQFDVDLPKDKNNASGIAEFENLLERFLQSNYNVNGAIYGAQIGYNWQRGALVYGVEAGINGTDMDGSAACAVIGYCQRELNWYATGTAHLGYAWGDTLFYGFGGGAWGDVKTKIGVVSSSYNFAEGEEEHTGWTAGLGIEHALNPVIRVRMEYSHVDLGKENTALSHNGEAIPYFSDQVDLAFDAIKIGAIFKLY